MTNPTIARIRHEISRIPAGVGRDAQSYKEELDRTLDALEVEETDTEEQFKVRTDVYRVLWNLSASVDQYWNGARGEDQIKKICEYQSEARRLLGVVNERAAIAAFSAPTLSVPIVPVEIDQHTIMCFRTGGLTLFGLAYLRGLQAQITALREERR